MDTPFVLLFFASLGASVAMMPVARILGIQAGILDHPEERKMQSTAIPRTGGIGILFGLMAGTFLLVRLSGNLGIPIGQELIAIFIGGVMIHLTGVLDDLLNLPAVGKLVAQSLAVGVVVSQGVVIERIILPGGVTWEFGFLAVPVTAFFLLGFINSINLVDGLDGLASGIVVIGALALAIFGLTEGNFVLAGLATILFGSVLGFLPFNFMKRKTFLGDAGSMLLGYMLGVTAISGAWFGGESTPLFIVLACAVMPFLDTVTTILRRHRKGQAIFRPDSMHLHHRLIRFGLSPRRTVLCILAVTLFAAGQSLVFFAGELRPLVATTTLAVVLVVLQIHRQRRRNETESDSSLREIAFYLLGAQDGEGPRMGGQLAMAEVLAGSSGETVSAITSTATTVVEAHATVTGRGKAKIGVGAPSRDEAAVATIAVD